MGENQAEKNLSQWMEACENLKSLLKNSSDDDIEEYIQITKKQSYVKDENKLRKQFFEMRDGKYKVICKTTCKGDDVVFEKGNEYTVVEEIDVIVRIEDELGSRSSFYQNEFKSFFKKISF